MAISPFHYICGRRGGGGTSPCMKPAAWTAGQGHGCPWEWLQGQTGGWVIAGTGGLSEDDRRGTASQGGQIFLEAGSCSRKPERGSFLELVKFSSLNVQLHHLIIYACYFIVCCVHQGPRVWFWLNMVVCTRCSVFFVSLWYLFLYMHGHHHPHAPHTCSIYAFIPCPPCIPHFFF